jgi:hypothetical protein
MTSLGFVIVIVAAICHATWNFFVKRINGGPALVWLFSVVSVLLYLPVAVYVIVLDKPDFAIWEISFIVGSAVLHLGYFMLLQAGYRKGDLFRGKLFGRSDDSANSGWRGHDRHRCRLSDRRLQSRC